MTAHAATLSPDVPLLTSTLNAFKQVTRSYALFHITFFSIAFLEVAAFALFFSLLTQTTLFAFSLAALFFTGFTYCVLLFYLQAKKPEDILAIKERFLSSVRRGIPGSATPIDTHQTLLYALEQLIEVLYQQEYRYYALPRSFPTLSPLMEKFSAWVHWKDLHHMKELLLDELIQEHIALIKLQPLEVSHHASLAKAYEILSWLYTDPRQLDPQRANDWASPEYASPAMREERQRSLLKAARQYQIVLAYAPQDPSVYAQLASVYRDLGDLAAEVRCYEALRAHNPTDPDLCERLGALYFSEGRSAEGLQLYNTLLQEGHTHHAASLIQSFA
jgi:tetratricopeptide (TPR) repeat protein